jgi:ferritin-like protein
VALAVLKLAGPLPILPNEPTDPEELVRAVVERERANVRSTRDDMHDDYDGKPDYAEHTQDVRERLARLAAAE